MKVSESGYTKEELLEIVDTYLAEQSRRWDFNFNNFSIIYLFNDGGPGSVGGNAGSTDILISLPE